MAKDVVMPVLGMSQDSGVLVRWLARSGDEVAAGTPLMEVETDKAVVEVDAPASGVLADVTLAEGESAAVGTVIARIYANGEARPEAPSDGAEAAAADPSAEAAPPGASERSTEADAAVASARAPAGGSAQGPATGPSPATGAADARGFVRSSPLARRLAEELGVALAPLAGRGAGPDGAVVAADVRSAARDLAARSGAGDRPVVSAGAAGAVGAAGAAGAAGTASDAARAGPSDRDVVTLSADVDLDALRRLAERLGGAAAPASAGDLLVLLAMLALRGALGAEVRVALRRVRDGVERSGVWSGDRPVLAWLHGLDQSDDASGGDPAAADAIVTDAASSRVRRRGGLGSRRLAVALGSGPTGSVTLDVSAAERDVALAERLIDDLVRVVEDPALAPFVLV